MKKSHEIVTESDIDSVWGNSNFGSMTRHNVVKYGLLAAASGYRQGHTATRILVELGLIRYAKNKVTLTLKGKRNLYEFFKNKENSM